MKVYLRGDNEEWQLFEGERISLEEEFVKRNIRIGLGAEIESEVRIDEGVVIGEKALIKERAILCKGANIGSWTQIGRETEIGAEVHIGERALIGERVSLTLLKPKNIEQEA